MTKKIDGKTKVLGIIGYPIKHTFSPYFQNAALDALRINAVYVPFEVEPKKLRGTLRDLAAIGVSGINVTIPHKEKVVPLLDKVSAEAKAIGAVNTIVFKGGKSIGYNTDAEGFLISFKKELKVNPKGKAIIIIGSGGAAKAISYVLAREGAASITFADVVYRKAKALARKIRKDFPRCTCRAVSTTRSQLNNAIRGSDILINATPVGMKALDPCVVDPKALHRGLVVYDIIYNPPLTPLLREARKRKIRAAGGIGMLLHQGALSFGLFTGKRAPISLMRARLKKTIGR